MFDKIQWLIATISMLANVRVIHRNRWTEGKKKPSKDANPNPWLELQTSWLQKSSEQVNMVLEVTTNLVTGGL